MSARPKRTGGSSHQGDALGRFLTLAAIVPPLIAAALILRDGVDVPAYDEWAFLAFFEKLSRSELSWEDLYIAHNEHRLLFPKLVYIGVGYLSDWNLRWEMLTTLGLAGLLALTVRALGNSTLETTSPARSVAFLMASMLIFGPVHCENWLWGIQMSIFFPVVCLTGGLAVLMSGLGRPFKVALCALLAIISTFSYGHGLLCWVLLFPLIVVGDWSSRWRVDGRLAIGWALGMTLAAGLYLRGLQPSVSSPAEMLAHPVAAAKYFAGFVGTPFAFGSTNPLRTAQLVGGLELGVLAAVSAYLLSQRRDLHLVRRSLPWLILAAFAMISGILVTASRMGLERAPVWRYSTTAALLALSLVYLVPITVDHARKTGHAAARGGGAWWVTAGLAAGMVLLHVTASRAGIEHSRQSRQNRLAGKAALLWADFFSDESLYQIHFQTTGLREAARRLEDLAYLRPGRVSAADVASLDVAPSARTHDVAARFCGTILEADRVRARGWAILPGGGTPAGAVVLAYRDADDVLIPFAIGRVGEPPANPAGAVDSRSANAGWTTTFLGRIPADAVGLSGWAFDTRTGGTCPLRAVPRGVPPDEETPHVTSYPLPSPGRPIDTIGVFTTTSAGSAFRLRNSNTPGSTDETIWFGQAGDLPLAGDWDGDGATDLGVYRPAGGTFLLQDHDDPELPATPLRYGPVDVLPVTGDWDGDGRATIGVYAPRERTFYLRNTNTIGTADLTIPFGAEGDVPVVGDWDGDGVTTIGVYRPSEHTFYLRNSNTAGLGEQMIPYGIDGDLPIAGDFFGTGTATVGVYRPSNGSFFFRNPHGPPDVVAWLDQTSGIPVVGDWDGR